MKTALILPKWVVHSLKPYPRAGLIAVWQTLRSTLPQIVDAVISWSGVVVGDDFADLMQMKPTKAVAQRAKDQHHQTAVQTNHAKRPIPANCGCARLKPLKAVGPNPTFGRKLTVGEPLSC